MEYIRREGTYVGLEQRQEQPKFVGNVITTAETPNALGGQTVLLYKPDDFGSIRNSANEIEVSENASSTTISIALMLANETLNHQPIILNGLSEFQQSVVNAAVFDERFALDKMLIMMFNIVAPRWLSVSMAMADARSGVNTRRQEFLIQSLSAEEPTQLEDGKREH